MTETTATTLDCIFTTAEYISKSGVIDYNIISNHMLIFLVRSQKDFC